MNLYKHSIELLGLLALSMCTSLKQCSIHFVLLIALETLATVILSYLKIIVNIKMCINMVCIACIECSIEEVMHMTFLT